MTPFQTESTYEASSDGAQGLLLFSFLERATHRWPDQIAVDVPPNEGHQSRVQITYKSLSQQSNTLAQILGQWVKRECVVGIFLPRNSAQLYIAQLGVLKAGGAYTCIDSSTVNPVLVSTIYTLFSRWIKFCIFYMEHFNTLMKSIDITKVYMVDTKTGWTVLEDLDH